MAHNCDCKDFAREGHATKLARDAAARIGARLNPEEARALVRYCANNRCTTSDALRRAIGHLSKTSDDPEAKLDAVAKALGLDPEATVPADMLAAVQELIDALNAAGSVPDGATGGSAEAPPAPLPPAIATASRDVQDKFRHLQADRARTRAAQTRKTSR